MSGKNPLGNGKEPQSYEGINVIVPVGGWRLVKSTRAPTTNDLKYPVGSLWVNTSTNSSYILTSNPGNWMDVSGSVSAPVSSAIASASAISLTTATPANVTSISLPAGIWQVSGQVVYNGAITVTGPQHASISTTSATLGTVGDNDAIFEWLTASLAQGDCSVVIPSYVLTLTATTTVYLVAQATFSAGTGKAYGRISAVKVG